MTFADIPAYRLRAHRIAGAGPSDPAAVVASLGAVQAQDYAGALWSVGLRCAGATEADLTAELARRRIVRTWALRGTLHLLAAEDVAWVLALVAPRLIAACGARWPRIGLDEAVLARSWRIIGRVLRDGPCPRDELMRRLEERGIATGGLRGYNLLWRLALERRICGGPPAGRRPTFVRCEDWLPPTLRLTRRAAVAELARRYFRSHGPATLEDFVHWSGLAVTEARAGWAEIRGELRRETIGGVEHLLAADAGPADAMAERAELLPGFDEYVIGYRDRSAVVKPADFPKLVPAKNGLFKPTLVIAGRVRGIWRRECEGRSRRITVSPFRPLRRVEQDAVRAAAGCYAAFLGGPAIVDFA